MTTENDQYIKEIEVTIEEMSHAVKKADVMRKLMNNSGFKEIMMEGFFEDFALSLIDQRAGVNSESTPANYEQNLRSVDNKLVAIGEVKSYFRCIMQMGVQAQRTIDTHKKELADVLSGEEEGTADE